MEANSVDTMRVIPSLFDLSKAGQLVLAFLELTNISPVDHCVPLGPFVSGYDFMDAGKIFAGAKLGWLTSK